MYPKNDFTFKALNYLFFRRFLRTIGNGKPKPSTKLENGTVRKTFRFLTLFARWTRILMGSSTNPI